MPSLRKQMQQFEKLFWKSKTHGEADQKEDTEILYTKHYKPLIENRAIMLACLIYRKRFSAFRRLNAALKDIGLSWPKAAPFICASPYADVLYVYPNLPGLVENDESIHNLTPYTDAENEYLSKILKIFKTAKNENKFNTPAKQISFVRKRVKISVTKFVSEYIGGTGADIRDRAEDITNELAPVQLKFCETWEDLDAFFHGGASSSCMHVKSDHSAAWRELYKKEKFHPGLFYLFYPYMQPVMIHAGSKVKARTIVHRYKKDGPWTHYGIIYSSSNGAKDILITLLKEAGICSVLDKENFEPPSDMFEIPGIWSNIENDFIAPTPWIDTIPSSYSRCFISFDIKRKVFVYDFTGKQIKYSKKISLRTQQGFVRAKSLFFTEYCYLCNGTIDNTHNIRVEDKTIFCSAEHAEMAGYTKTYQADGSYIWLNKDVSEKIKSFWGNYRYTTLYAAMNNKQVDLKCYPVLFNLNSSSFSGVFSVCLSSNCWKIEKDGKIILIPKSLHEYLKSGYIKAWSLVKSDSPVESGVYKLIPNPKYTKGDCDDEVLKLIDW